MCVNDAHGIEKHVVFQVTNGPASGVRTLDPAVCYEGLRREIDGCPRGGESGYEGFLFR